MRFMSTAALPRPTVPLMLSRAETWRRLPLISTRVWSGLRPRRVAGRSASEPSAIEGCGKLNEGTSWLRILLVSVWPELAIASRADDVDRDRAVGDGAVGPAGAGDDDRLVVAGGGRVGASPAPAGSRSWAKSRAGGQRERGKRRQQSDARHANHLKSPAIWQPARLRNRPAYGNLRRQGRVFCCNAKNAQGLCPPHHRREKPWRRGRGAAKGAA